MTKAKRPKPPTSNRPRVVDRRLLAAMPLPEHDAAGDKGERGAVLIVGGSSEMPGAVMLGALAALRAGAGKLQIATTKGVAPILAANVPEARVLALAESSRGTVVARAARALDTCSKGVGAVLFGPGFESDDEVASFVAASLPKFDDALVVLDAGALTSGRAPLDLLRERNRASVLTPHAGEMATMLGVDKREIEADPLGAARAAAHAFGAVVTLKGATTHIVEPGGAAFVHESATIGLATSGSGDTLSGVIAGLAARGASATCAAVWGVYLHARAGERLSRRLGPVGFLARELLAEIPPLMARKGR